ncbi:MAG: hypothetical protein ACQKBV_03280, partial [Puniceicoccales bacterium]
RNYVTWREVAFFPTYHGDPGIDLNTVWLANLDYDHDGRINAMEYALGGDPQNGDVAARPIAYEIVEIAGQFYPTITFAQQIAADDLEYDVFVSDDLESWAVNGDGGGPYTTAPVELSLNDDGTRQVRVRGLVPLGSINAKPYMQLVITLNQQ